MPGQHRRRSGLLAWAGPIKAEGMVRSSTRDGRRPFIHSEDIAAVSVSALIEANFTKQILSTTGPASLTFAKATQIIGRAIG